MSQENVEIVTGLFEHWGTDYWRDHISEDVVWDASAIEFPGVSGVYRGHEGVLEFFRTWLEPWQDPTVELVEAIDAGDSVFIQMLWRGRGQGSGAEVERNFFGVYDLRDGLVVGFRQAETRAEGLEAAGLSGTC
jgi:ketosteroid isomerase-like protein